MIGTRFSLGVAVAVPVAVGVDVELDVDVAVEVEVEVEVGVAVTMETVAPFMGNPLNWTAPVALVPVAPVKLAV